MKKMYGILSIDIINISKIVFCLFFPGYTLVRLLFPDLTDLVQEHTAIYSVVLGIAMSITMIVITGTILSFYQLFTFTNICILLIIFTIIFFVIGIYRGAYKTLTETLKNRWMRKYV